MGNLEGEAPAERPTGARSSGDRIRSSFPVKSVSDQDDRLDDQTEESSEHKRSQPRRGRDPYAVVGIALRHAVGKAERADLGTLEWSVLAAVIALVSSYSRLEDRVYVREVAAFVYGLEEAALKRWHRTKVSQALRRLRDECGIVRYEPAQGSGHRSLVGLPLVVEDEEKAPCGGSLSPDRKGSHARGEKAPLAPRTKSHTEKYSEKKSQGENEVENQNRTATKPTRDLRAALVEEGFSDQDATDALAALEKKRANGPVGNPLAFVRTCALNARKQREEETATSREVAERNRRISACSVCGGSTYVAPDDGPAAFCPRCRRPDGTLRASDEIPDRDGQDQESGDGDMAEAIALLKREFGAGIVREVG